MMRRLLADRERELELFDRMVAGKTWECILLIESGSGMGKSTLLREYERRSPSHVSCVTVDFKGDLSLADAFYLLGRGLGMLSLPQFSARVGQMIRPEKVVVSRNVVIGQVEIQVALQSPDEETRWFRRAALTDAFFADLAALKRRVVFIFDTLNEAAPDAREWLGGPFLGHVRHSRDVVAVVASRPPLEVHTTWAARCEHVRLQAITEPEEWHAGLRDFDPALAIVVPIEWIQAYCVCFDGHPMHMMSALERAIRAGQGIDRIGGGR
jgi:hypothetical protein